MAGSVVVVTLRQLLVTPSHPEYRRELPRSHNHWNCRKRKKLLKSLRLAASNWDQDEVVRDRLDYYDWADPCYASETKTGKCWVEGKLDRSFHVDLLQTLV